MVSIRFISILALLHAFAYDMCDALPPSMSARYRLSPNTLALNISASIDSFDPFSISQRMEMLLNRQIYFRDPLLRQATLTGVFLTQANGEQIPTNDCRRLQYITASFRVHEQSPRPGFRTTFLFANAGGSAWQILDKMERRQEIWEKEHEFKWGELEARMTLQEADRRIKAAGFMWPLYQINIERFDEWPLAYCFKFSQARLSKACIGVLDGHIWAVT
ncbi:MAG: hypothetical protein Q9209_002421 [Squamulea sp. 1 TL-2023]